MNEEGVSVFFSILVAVIITGAFIDDNGIPATDGLNVRIAPLRKAFYGRRYK